MKLSEEYSKIKRNNADYQSATKKFSATGKIYSEVSTKSLPATVLDPVELKVRAEEKFRKEYQKQKKNYSASQNKTSP